MCKYVCMDMKFIELALHNENSYYYRYEECLKQCKTFKYFT